MNVVTPRIYLLNEQHELGPTKGGGGGSSAKLRDVDWRSKAASLRLTLREALASDPAVVDPTASVHHFLLATPDLTLEYDGTSRGEHVVKPKEVAFAGAQGRLFRRIGFDVVGTLEGAAVLHIDESNRARFENDLDNFEELGSRRQSDLALIGGFGAIPLELRVERAWLDEALRASRVDVILELMPVIRGDEIERVVVALRRFLLTHEPAAKWKRVGRDFSRRGWLRLELAPKAIESTLRAFPSIQRAHPPLYWEPAGRGSKRRAAMQPGPPPVRACVGPRPVSRAPIVAVVDMGVPEAHAHLSGNVVAARFRGAGVLSAQGHHGSKVASRVVFPPYEDLESTVPGTPLCLFADLNASDPEEGDRLDPKTILPLMDAAITSNPDIRVFNLSCGMGGELAPLSILKSARPQWYDEALRQIADLDNFAYRNDALIVIACGNAPRTAIPTPPYPDHHEDSLWHLAAPAPAVNAITVGSTVGGHVSTETIVDQPDQPSPFARVGRSPLPMRKPDLAFIGGNMRVDGAPSPWVGVPVLDRTGAWVTEEGSSFAAPVIAREAAFLWRRLREIGDGQVEPYAVTVRACLALTARPPTDDTGIRELARLSFGFGYPHAEVFFSPRPEHALLVWQGMLKAPKLQSRVKLPIPRAWVGNAVDPILRVAWCWDPPVNPAAPDVWMCRDVWLHVRPSSADGAPALRGKSLPHGEGSMSSLHVREYALKTPAFHVKTGVIVELPDDDVWTLDVGYDEQADLPDPTYSSLQRVAVVAELVDRQGTAGPQEALQQMQVTQTMTRLGITGSSVLVKSAAR